MTSSLSKKKESLNRKLIDSRYKSWLKRLENDTPSARQRYNEAHPRRSPQKIKDDIQHYAAIESDSLKAIRELINIDKPTAYRFRLLGRVIEFNKIPLNTIHRITQAMTLNDEIQNLIEIFQENDRDVEEKYTDCRQNIYNILNQPAIPLFEEIYGNEIEFVEEMSALGEELDAYVHDFYKTYLHYKAAFEEAHEQKRLLLRQSGIEESIVKNTLFLHILVHGDIPYKGNSIITTPSPMNVYNLLHASPGCVFFSSGQERRLYNKVHLFIDKYKRTDDTIHRVISSTMPVMSALNEKVKHNTLSKIKTTRRHAYVKDYLEQSTLERFYTAQGENIVNKEFSFELRVKPLHISKNFNLEGIKLIGAKHIEDAVDLVDYLPLTINETNQITFTMRDIFGILPNVENIVIIDASCQSSIHPVSKTSLNYRAVTKKSQYRK